MAKNPYKAPDGTVDIVDLLWEAELIADEFSDGGLILIRTKEGWRAFLGCFGESQAAIERRLDKNVPSYEKGYSHAVDRKPTLREELERLIPDVGSVYPGYRPMALSERSEQESSETHEEEQIDS